MDKALAQRMHEVLAHKEAQYPSSCPICREQAPKVEDMESPLLNEPEGSRG